MKTLIENRITELKKEKEETLAEYQTCFEFEKDVLAERNSRISMELKFLNQLMQL